MGLPVLQKRASDLLDPFVGGTEQNIAGAFAEAREAQAFLVFDEADSLLLERADAVRSWEISQVNEMLTWMEQHALPFACTTNLAERLDRASLRRFLVKLRFDWLTPAQARLAFRRFFGTGRAGGPGRAARADAGRLRPGAAPGGGDGRQARSGHAAAPARGRVRRPHRREIPDGVHRLEGIMIAVARRTSPAAFVKWSIGRCLVTRTASIYGARHFEQCVRLCRIEAPLSGEFKAIHVETLGAMTKSTAVSRQFIWPITRRLIPRPNCAAANSRSLLTAWTSFMPSPRGSSSSGNPA